jgi:integrase
MRHVETYCDGPSSRVFTSPDGGPLRPRNWRARFFDPAVAAAGLGPYIDEDDEEQREHRGVRPYDLRHTAATLMLANHASIRQVADRLGHSSPSVTLNV